jgi:hypothetical protein
MANGITNAEVEALIESARERGIERVVSVDWVALSSDGFPGDAVTSAPTREALIEELVGHFDGDRESVDHKLLHGDIFLRERVTVSAWADDEGAAPSLGWVSDGDAAALATARAEAALAEREACAAIAHATMQRAKELSERCEDTRDGFAFRGDVHAASCIEADIVHRTTPATLSTDTLAAIAEARGLRVVEPEHLAELEAAARDAKKTAALAILETGDGLVKHFEALSLRLDALAEECMEGSESRRIYAQQAENARAVAETIRERMPRPSALYQGSGSLAERGGKDGAK